MFNRLFSIMITLSLFLMISAPIKSALAQEQVTVTPIFKEVNSNSIYEIKFTPSQAIPADARIVVTFPKVFDISKVKIAGSATINGGFVTSVKDSVVFIQRSGLGRIIKAGENVDLQFATIKNPELAKAWSVTVEIQAKSGNLISTKRSTVNISEKAK